MKSKYKPYPNYRDSGVDWLGEIPEEWEATKLKYHTSIYNGNSISDNQKSNYENQDESISMPYISTKDLDAKYFTVEYNNGLGIPSQNKSLFKVAKASSTLVCIEGGSAGKKLAYLKNDVCFVNKLACVESLKTLDSKYTNYFIHSSLFKYSFELATTGLIPGVSISELKDILSLYPPLQEQKAIANYLDSATAKIDTLIEKQTKLIELLKEKRQAVISTAVTRGLDNTVAMKDSGVEWLGEIPEHWDVKKLKNSARIQGGKDQKAVLDDNGEYPVYGSGGIFGYANKYLHDGESVLLGRKGTVDKPLYVNDKFWTVDTMYYTVIERTTIAKWLYYSATTINFDYYQYGLSLIHISEPTRRS